jgi:hypothetical protein
MSLAIETNERSEGGGRKSEVSGQRSEVGGQGDFSVISWICFFLREKRSTKKHEPTSALRPLTVLRQWLCDNLAPVYFKNVEE